MNDEALGCVVVLSITVVPFVLGVLVGALIW